MLMGARSARRDSWQSACHWCRAVRLLMACCFLRLPSECCFARRLHAGFSVFLDTLQNSGAASNYNRRSRVLAHSLAPSLNPIRPLLSDPLLTDSHVVSSIPVGRNTVMTSRRLLTILAMLVWSAVALTAWPRTRTQRTASFVGTADEEAASSCADLHVRFDHRDAMVQS